MSKTTDFGQAGSQPVHCSVTERGRAQRAALIEASIQAIAAAGFENFTTRKVAARTHMNIATLHYYFATKEELIRAVINRVLGELSDPLLPHANEDPLTGLGNQFATTFDRIRRRPEIFRVLIELHARSSHDQFSRSLLEDVTSNWREYILSYLRRGTQQGQFRHDIDLDVYSLGIMATIKGIVMECLRDPSKTTEAESFASEIIRLITIPERL